ncbi:Metallopeptidase [Aphelenchoides besseyi]|nr:Metallopeptidase [Aphelenchoides besseyi]
MILFILVFGACIAHSHAKRHPLRDYPWGPNIEPKPILLSTTQNPTTEVPIHIWPLGRIPYVDDPALVEDEDQAVALNNARMDLQVRTCIKFVKRRNEQDYVFFTDLGLDAECWNMFERNKGHVAVNAGPACLAPMRWPYKPKQVFSECDIEYVNHLYKCPRKRKQSPICPAGHTIMSLPEPFYEKTDRNRRPYTLITPRIRGRHSTTTQLPYIIDELQNTPPIPPLPLPSLSPTTLPPTLPPTTTTTTPSTTTTMSTTTSTTTIPTTTTTTTTTITTTTETVATVPSTTTMEIEKSTDFPDFTDDIETPPFLSARMKTNKSVLKAHYANRTTAHVPHVLTPHIPTKSPKLLKEKVGSVTKYVGSCGSPCNYTGQLLPLRRSYNDKIGVTDHFYTTDLHEQQLKIKDGYLLQKDHLLTTMEHEKDMAERILGFKFDKALGFCTKEPGCGAYVPLYRFYNPIAKVSYNYKAKGLRMRESAILPSDAITSRQKPAICCIHGTQCKKGIREAQARRQDQAATGVSGWKLKETSTPTPYNSLKLPPTISEDENGYANLNPTAQLPLIPVPHDNNFLSAKPSDRRGPERKSLIFDGENRSGSQFPKLNSRLSSAPKDNIYENIEVMNENYQAAQPPKKFIRGMDSKRVTAVRGNKSLADFYIGILNSREAVRQCNKLASFRVYHKLPSKLRSVEDLKGELTLYIVYCTSTGSHLHFPIVRKLCTDPASGLQSFKYYVDCANTEIHFFGSLDALVYYYATYGHLHPTADGSVQADLFP